ncbi:OLC1v1029615C1 [Oldenlandia corymbosa var. corymbosa]|uniref:OLC1v1029615C1 n=1 Tax=Oldenlandia corymbosa var. corymbosa TaxID=529605 RepID=A0AAV1CHE3_OLDCO|nr:OLC1v1029615C1 [Oldenlandia corymbosa var. corymbosa]
MLFLTPPLTNLISPSIMSFLTNSKSPLVSNKHFISNPFSTSQRDWNREVSQFSEIHRRNLLPWRKKNKAIVIPAAEGLNGNNVTAQRRKVVEHICLIKAKDDLSDEQEKDMLDYLYTTQYHMRGIVAISLGRVSDKENASYTHAIFMRFQKKEDLTRFYDNPNYVGVLTKHVFPHCHGILNVDYESEVEDDILPIFRKGEEFNYGVEFLLLMAFYKNSLGGPAEEAMAALAKLTTELPSLIVQATKGSNFNPDNSGYSHAIAIRFRSSEAFEMFIESSEYNDIWQSKFQPITEKSISLHFSVDPVGTELM